MALLASGCATNPLRIEAAGDFSKASDEAGSRTLAYINDVRDRQRRAAAALVASDPNCVPMPIIRMQRAPLGTRNAPPPRCLDQDAAPTPGWRAFEVRLEPLSLQALKPRILMITAIADYSAALAKIVGREKPDVSKEIEGFASKVDAVGGVLALAASDGPKATDLIAEPEAKAIIGVIQMAAELRREQDQVDAIRKRVAEDGNTVDAALKAVRGTVDVTLRGQDEASGFQEAGAMVDGYREGAKGGWDYTRRSSEALAILNARADAQGAGARVAVVLKALDEVSEAHAQLHELLKPNPTLSEEQRRKRAGIAEERLFRALRLIGGLAVLL
jgi:hypothetical protein